MDDQGVLIFAGPGVIAEVRGTGDNDALVNDYHFMMRAMSVAIQRHFNTVFQEVVELPTCIADTHPSSG